MNFNLLEDFWPALQLRKDLYVLVTFHLFINMWLTYCAYPLARLVHCAK